ncbi:hypothetical protein VK792_07630 [Mesobacterium sp. TK19101]|uniref:Transferrin-binding protein B C-lobe/N-lobe beta barrel domain-containing protein n=1 Tax=Mesobacterium hydrothermale TaxID=3111907 RepID=A0ABU6HFA6_9RHOB|nr:hypothetical protein [Mesobacterium sp. TK19101]MEC3861150.1 hypothetical protein [Mesobacterium sp. TK19101]
MFARTFPLFALSATLLSGCGGITATVAQSPQPANSAPTVVAAAALSASAFVVPAADGSIGSDLIQTSADAVIDTDGDGYGYLAGKDASDSSLHTVAGLVGGDALTALPGSGTASYDGYFELYHLNRPTTGSSRADLRSLTGAMTITLDMTNDSFSGASAGTVNGRPALMLSGQITGDTLTGIASYTNGTVAMTGDMIGRAGTEKVIGAYHGNNGSDSFAGGFLATP